MNKVVFLECAGLVFYTGFILEDELEDAGHTRTSRDKFDK